MSDALAPRSYMPFSSSKKIRHEKLSLTPHHLFYLLSKFEELGVDVGPMNVRLENLQNDHSHSNYVSFLNAPKNKGKQADAESLRSVSSMRSVMSSMSSFWSGFTMSSNAVRIEKQMTQNRDDVKYLYASFTKIPALRLAPDHRARLIAGFEEFPFDMAVPLFAFKNVSSLEISDVDFRQFHGWDRMSEQLRVLVVRRANVDDPIDLLLHIVLDDMERRRKRSSKISLPQTPSTPGAPWPSNSPKTRQIEIARTASAPNTPLIDTKDGAYGTSLDRNDSAHPSRPPLRQHRERSVSPGRPTSGRQNSLATHARHASFKFRTSSGSSESSAQAMTPRYSTSDLSLGILPSSKWRFLRFLSLAENGLHILTPASLAPVAATLYSLDLSSNLFSEVPDALASLTNLHQLNLSNCMIESLQSLSRHPLPAITTLNLRSNRLSSLSGIERTISLERVDFRDNRLRDPTELARLTGFPDIAEVYVVKNPFVRTHGSYRITIFNLFRKTPGNVRDVIIDSLGPSYNEKKYLVDRAPEPVSVPVVKPPLDDEEPSQQQAGTSDNRAEYAVEQDDAAGPEEPNHREGHRRTTSEGEAQLTRRKKKVPRRRMIELSTPESTKSPKAQKSLPDLAEAAAPRTPPTDTDQPSTPEQTPYHTAPTQRHALLNATSPPKRPTLATAFESPTPVPKIRNQSDDDDDPSVSPQDLGHSDFYRQKIESLKTELGPSWLSALHGKVDAEQQAPPPPPPPPPPPQSNRRSFSPSSRTSTIKADGRSARGAGKAGRTLG